MCGKPQSAVFLVSASPHPCPHPGQKLASSSSVGFCSPCRTYVQGSVTICSVRHLSWGICRVQGGVLVLRSKKSRSRTPIPFRRIPCILGLLLGAVRRHCFPETSPYVGRWSAGAERPGQSQCSSPKAWVAGQRGLGREAGRCRGVVAQVATPAPLSLAVSAGAGGQGQALAPGPAPALPALALISWSGRLPESPARLLATPLPPAPLSHMGLEVPRDGMSWWGKVSSSRSPWFSYRRPRQAVTLGFLSSPESLGANPELTWKHPASEWAACREGGASAMGWSWSVAGRWGLTVSLSCS